MADEKKEGIAGPRNAGSVKEERSLGGGNLLTSLQTAKPATRPGTSQSGEQKNILNEGVKRK